MATSEPRQCANIWLRMDIGYTAYTLHNGLQLLAQTTGVDIKSNQIKCGFI